MLDKRSTVASHEGRRNLENFNKLEKLSELILETEGGNSRQG